MDPFEDIMGIHSIALRLVLASVLNAFARKGASRLNCTAWSATSCRFNSWSVERRC